MNINIKYTFDILKKYWINIYINLLNYIIYNIEKNFINKKFIQYTTIISTKTKSILIKIY